MENKRLFGEAKKFSLFLLTWPIAVPLYVGNPAGVMPRNLALNVPGNMCIFSYGLEATYAAIGKYILNISAQLN